MRKFLLSILIIIVVIIAHCLVPFVLFKTGKYDTTSFFSKPPSVKLKKAHIDNNIDGGSAWRLTSIIKTHNMVDSIVEFRMKFYYKDGTPVLSKLDSNPIEIKREIIVPIGEDHSFTNVTNINYNQFPDESVNQKMKWLISLKYKDRNRESKEHDQSTSGYFIFYGYNSSGENGQVVADVQTDEKDIVNVQTDEEDITIVQSDEDDIDAVQIIHQQEDFDVKITSIESDVIGDNGQLGMKVWTKISLPGGGHHNYRVYFFFYDDKGPIKDVNNSYNVEKNVGHIGKLGEYDIPKNKRKDVVYSFFFPISELHRGGDNVAVQMFVQAKLQQDDKDEEVATSHVRAFKIYGTHIVTNDIY